MTERNAHPHTDTADRVHVVVNGIVENWAELRRRLETDGAEFTSETDAEVVAHLISHHLEDCGDLIEATRLAYNDLRGHYAFVAMSADSPGVPGATARRASRSASMVGMPRASSCART